MAFQCISFLPFPPSLPITNVHIKGDLNNEEFSYPLSTSILLLQQILFKLLRNTNQENKIIQGLLQLAIKYENYIPDEILGPCSSTIERAEHIYHQLIEYSGGQGRTNENTDSPHGSYPQRLQVQLETDDDDNDNDCQYQHHLSLPLLLIIACLPYVN